MTETLDAKSLLRFGMTKVYSGIPPLPESLRMPRVTTCGDFIQPG